MKRDMKRDMKRGMKRDMKRKEGRLAAGALALAAAAALWAPAAALADVTAPGGTASSTITGTIVATQLKVTVPTAAAFTIDPTIDTAAAPAATGPTAAQITSQAANFTITNNSAVPVYAHISSVTAAGGTPAPTLVSTEAQLTGVKSLMLAVKDAKPANFAAAADWLTAHTGMRYYPVKAAEHGKLAPSGAAGGANSATMQIYGKTTTGWAHGDSFTVTPVFTISVADPGAAV